MKKRALILTAVLTAAALTGGSGYLPVTDGIRAKMIQNVYADAEDSKESADTETSDSVLDQATIMYQQYNYDEAIKLLKKQDDFTKNKDYMDLAAKCQIAKKSLVEYPLEKITHVFFHTLIEDTSRAFDGDSKSGNYNQVMTTVSEFNKIIQIMYDKGYVLVSPHDMATPSSSPPIEPTSASIDIPFSLQIATNSFVFSNGIKSFQFSGKSGLRLLFPACEQSI